MSLGTGILPLTGKANIFASEDCKFVLDHRLSISHLKCIESEVFQNLVFLSYFKIFGTNSYTSCG